LAAQATDKSGHSLSLFTAEKEGLAINAASGGITLSYLATTKTLLPSKFF